MWLFDYAGVPLFDKQLSDHFTWAKICMSFCWKSEPIVENGSLSDIDVFLNLRNIITIDTILSRLDYALRECM